MVVYCEIPYGEIATWCRNQGYVEVPISDYNSSNRPLLVVDNRIQTKYHEKTFTHKSDILSYIRRAKGTNIHFGLVRAAISYIGDMSLAIWSKK